MSGIAIIVLIIIAVIVVFLLVLVGRAAAFKPKAGIAPHQGPVTVDAEAAVSNLQKLVQCRTESYEDHSLEDNAEFEKLVRMLPELYPNVFAQCEYTELPDRELLFRWKGQSDARASVLMAHYDVVPVEEENWEKPAFAGIIEDGVLWGRGTLDTKVTFNGILTAANTLIGQGFVPKEDIYMAFSGQEEVNGPGAARAVEYFREHGVELSMVVDEGGAVVEDVFPGVKERYAEQYIEEYGEAPDDMAQWYGTDDINEPAFGHTFTVKAKVWKGSVMITDYLIDGQSIKEEIQFVAQETSDAESG